MKNNIKVILLIVGTIIGAGFASGKEIYLFFTRYGIYGIFGIIISGIITSLIILKTLNIVNKNNIKNYNEFIQIINPKHKCINKIINIIINSFLLVSFYIMISGFSSYINQTYKIPIYISSIIFVIVCYFILNKSINGVIKANQVLIPCLVLFIIFLGLKNIKFISEIKSINLEQMNSKGWFISGILYMSYNSIVLIPVLTTIQSYIKTKNNIRIISIFSFIIISILSFVIYGLLLRGIYFIKEVEMPLINISMEFGYVYKYIYGFVIIVSIFTSAISAGNSLMSNIAISKNNKNIILILISIIGVLISNIGFSKLVEILYPIFGVLGLVQIILILKKN